MVVNELQLPGSGGGGGGVVGTGEMAGGASGCVGVGAGAFGGGDSAWEAAASAREGGLLHWCIKTSSTETRLCVKYI